MPDRSVRIAVRLVALVLLTAATATPSQAQIQTYRRVFVLAGQSNTYELRTRNGTGCSSPGVTQANVSYAEAISDPVGSPWRLEPIPTQDVVNNAYPMLTLGNRLGAAFPNEQVELVMIAQSGSALLWRNSFANFAWIDPLNPGNPQTWVNRLEPVMNKLGLTDFDSLHIVWGQGEADCLPLQTTTTAEYMTEAQNVFFELAADAGKSAYEVHLVTLGAIYRTLVSDSAWNVVRDAYFGMPSNLLPLPAQVTIRPAAHHYDLAHDDWVHLTDCEYVTLASRIADGILFPTALPLRSSTPPSIIPGTNDILIPTTVALAPMAFGQSTNKFFEVTVGGVTLSPSDFHVATSGASVIVRVKGATLTPTNFSVRHVAGTGDALDWETMPTIVDAVLGLPLEPFVAP